MSQFEAVLNEEQIASHGLAQVAIDRILAEGWREMGRRLRPHTGGAGSLTEFEMVQWLSEAMRREGLVWENGPNVSANANSSDSHYEPTATNSVAHPRRRLHPHRHLGQARPAGSIFYDITWTGVVGREPIEQSSNRCFEIVRNARDAAIATVEQAFAAGPADLRI